VISAIMGVILNIKQNFIKPLIRVSSLSNTRWIILAAMYSFSIWLFYFLIYTITLRLILTINNFFFISDLHPKKNNRKPSIIFKCRRHPPIARIFPQNYSFNGNDTNKNNFYKFVYSSISLRRYFYLLTVFLQKNFYKSK